MESSTKLIHDSTVSAAAQPCHRLRRPRCSTASRRTTSTSTSASSAAFPATASTGNTYATTAYAPRPSRLELMRGRQAIFLSWITTAPFVTSFVEDVDPGTARTTRENTLHNRTPPSSPLTSKHRSVPISKRPRSPTVTRHPDTPSSSTLHTNASSSSSSASESRSARAKSISFAELVHVYSSDNVDTPTTLKVELSSKELSLKVRHAKSSSSLARNPAAPTSMGGKWLLRSKSAGELPNAHSQG